MTVTPPRTRRWEFFFLQAFLVLTLLRPFQPHEVAQSPSSVPNTTHGSTPFNVVQVNATWAFQNSKWLGDDVRDWCWNDETSIRNQSIWNTFRRFPCCIGTPHRTRLLVLFLLLLLGWLLFLMVTVAEEFFCPAIEAISDLLKLPPNVAGATLLSLGNGAPDLFSQFAAINEGSERGVLLALCSVLGAGIFITTFVLGSVLEVAPVSHRYIPINVSAYQRDTAFYLVAVLLVFVSVLVSASAPVMALLLALYIIYVIVVLLTGCVQANEVLSRCLIQDEDHERTRLLPGNGRVPSGRSVWVTVKQYLASIVTLALFPVRNSSEFVLHWIVPSIEWPDRAPWAAALGSLTLLLVQGHWRSSLLTCVVIGVFGHIFYHHFGFKRPRLVKTCILVASCLFCILWMHKFSELLISVIMLLGGLLNINSNLLGATILAWSNSSGDFIVNTEVSKDGYPSMGIAACYGGPLFAMLVGFGLAMFLRTAMYGAVSIPITNGLLLLFGFHIAQLVHAVLALPLLYRWNLSKKMGLWLMGYYGIFSVIYGLTSMGVIFKNPWLN